MKKEIIHAAKSLSGGVEPPGDKSISHRYAMLAALADGASELRNFAAARDCHSTLGCMKSLGAEVMVKGDRKSTRLNSSHSGESRMPSSA